MSEQAKLIVHFDGMAWPAPGERLSEIAWNLRYGSDEVVLADRLSTASVLNAYEALFALPNKMRNSRIREILKLARPAIAPKEES
jgi:hypothetical protein